MKKLTPFLLALTLWCVSCGKTPTNEWSRFYAYTMDDVVGHYEANPDESLYEELPTQGVAVYDNVVIDIVSLSETLVSLHIVIPDKINKTYSGTLDTTDEHRTDIILHGFNEDFMATVYTNSQNQVRLHGRVKQYYYDANGVLVNSNNYGFDVIKSE